MILTPLIVFGVIAFGLVMGSAVTALVHRIPRDISWVRGRSACPACGAVLAARDLIPLLSYAATLGRCRHCGVRIPPRYPVTELLCAAWALLLYLRVGPSPDYPLLAIWGFLLIALTWIDLDFKLLPDALTFPGALIGAAAALMGPGARHAIGGVVLGSGVLWLLAWGYWKLRRVEGMGGGDIKLAAMFGVVLGWQLTLLTLFMAALAGSVWGAALWLRGVGDGKTELPFGSLLAPAALAAFLWGGGWIESYVAVAFGP